MRELSTKNIIHDMQSKKKSWEDIKVPEELRFSLEDLKMDKPSIIQANSIPKINDNQSENYLFQAGNGSGKTLAFSIPSIMRVDPENPNI